MSKIWLVLKLYSHSNFLGAFSGGLVYPLAVAFSTLLDFSCFIMPNLVPYLFTFLEWVILPQTISFQSVQEVQNFLQHYQDWFTSAGIAVVCWFLSWVD